jgi:single-strand DNA-binding protein
MAGSVNKVILIGNLGADPEIKRTQDGRPIANLRIATSDSWKDKNTGEKREKTEWHRVVVFSEGLCKVIEQYVKKGSKVYIEGQLQTRKWQNQEGNDQYSTEVVLQGFDGKLVMLGNASGDSSQRPPQGQQSQANTQDNYEKQYTKDTQGNDYSDQSSGNRSYAQNNPGTGGGEIDDEIPF